MLYFGTFTREHRSFQKSRSSLADLTPQRRGVLSFIVLLLSMAQTDYPDDTALTAWLTGLGVTSIPSGIDLQDQIDAAVEELERISGQSPFLVQALNADFKFDPSRTTQLNLRSRWVSIATVTVAGDAKTEDTDFWLKPYGGPYTYIEFDDALISDGQPLSITVNGKRGYASELPQRVYDALLNYAAGSVMRASVIAGTTAIGPKRRIKQDSVEIEYAGGSSAQGQDSASVLQERARAVFASVRSVRVMGV